MSDRVLMSFNPSFPVVVACDSSAYGIGAVLSHHLPDGTDRPVAFASRTLSQAERKYVQIEKFALALYWGVTRFRLYLEGPEIRPNREGGPSAILGGDAFPTISRRPIFYSCH